MASIGRIREEESVAPLRAGWRSAASVALGGGAGSVLRYLVGDWATSAWAGIPVGTLIVNVLGSALLGGLLGAFTRRRVAPEVRAGLTVGFCGGFTTFSAFSYEAVSLFAASRYADGAAYAFASTALSLGGFAIGYRTSRAR